MSELREKIADAIAGAVSQDDRYLEHADAVLRVLAEHGDTQQVREQVSGAIWAVTHRGEWRAGEVFDTVMAVVAPIVAARDAAVERAADAERDLAEMQGHYAMARERTERAEADLATARQQLDQVRALIDKWERLGWRANRAELREVLDAPARPAGHDETGQ